MADYLKGQIAEMAQINSETLRYYERSKLIPPPKRSPSGYRLYTGATLLRLEFIKNAKASGFTLKQIKDMFTIAENQNPKLREINHAVDEKIMEIDSRITGLTQMKNMLILFKSNGSQSAQCPHIKAFLNNFAEE